MFLILFNKTTQLIVEWEFVWQAMKTPPYIKSSMLRRFYIALILEKLLKVKQERNGSITNMIRCFKETNDWVHATNGSLPVSGTNLKYFRTLNEGIN